MAQKIYETEADRIKAKKARYRERKKSDPEYRARVSARARKRYRNDPAPKERQREASRRFYARKIAEDPDFFRKQYQKYRDTIRKCNAVKKAKRTAIVNEFKADGCLICGERDVVCLSAHHRDPAEKDFNIAARDQVSLDKLYSELAKCVCLCENCHRKEHAGHLEIPA